MGLLLIACSPRGGGVEDYSSALDPAVELFVEGRYAEAAARLEKLEDELTSREGLTELYLYLGRAYLELEQYDRAIDAFTAGVSYGGAGPFHEYLARLGRMKESSPENIAAADKITRAQVALAIDRVVFRLEPDLDGADGGPGSGGPGESEAVRRGIVTYLPDGEFHAQEVVTRAAFYAIVCRLLDSEYGVEAARVFPGGFRWVTQGGPGANAHLSGREAVSVLQQVAALGDTRNGR